MPSLAERRWLTIFRQRITAVVWQSSICPLNFTICLSYYVFAWQCFFSQLQPTRRCLLSLTLGLIELFTAQSDSIIARWEHNKGQTLAATTSVYLADPLPTTGFSLFVLIVSAWQTRPKQALYPVATVSTSHWRFSEKLKYLQPWSAQRGHKQMVAMGMDAFYQCDCIWQDALCFYWKQLKKCGCKNVLTNIRYLTIILTLFIKPENTVKFNIYFPGTHATVAQHDTTCQKESKENRYIKQNPF